MFVGNMGRNRNLGGWKWLRHLDLQGPTLSSSKSAPLCDSNSLQMWASSPGLVVKGQAVVYLFC